MAFEKNGYARRFVDLFLESSIEGVSKLLTKVYLKHSILLMHFETIQYGPSLTVEELLFVAGASLQRLCDCPADPELFLSFTPVQKALDRRVTKFGIL